MRAVLVIIVIIVVIGLWAIFLVPKFDEKYVVSLLSRQDPTLVNATFDEMDTEQESGRLTLSKFDYTFFMTNSSLGVREVEILEDDNGSVINGRIWSLSSTPLDTVAKQGKTRDWICPGATDSGNTSFNLTVEETGQYLYIGTTSTYVPVLALQQRINRSSAQWNESMDESFWEGYELMPIRPRLSEAFYYNPDERGEFDDKLSWIYELLEPCKEVTA